MRKTEQALDGRLERFAGAGLAGGGVFYFLFYGSGVGGFGLGDDCDVRDDGCGRQDARSTGSSSQAGDESQGTGVRTVEIETI